MFRPSSRYDHAMFWLALGAVVVAIGGILWSHGGVIAVVVGTLMLWWALTLYLAHRHSEGHFCPDPEAHRLPKTGPAALQGSGPEVLSVLRELRADLRDATRKIDSSRSNRKFWSAGSEGNLQDKGWRRHRDQLQGMSGMTPLWDGLEDAFEHLKRVAQLRADRVFKGYRLQDGDGDTLNAALASIQTASEQLDAKIATLDRPTASPGGVDDPNATGARKATELVERLKELRSFADIIRQRIPLFGQGPVPDGVDEDLDNWIARVSVALESKPELRRQFDSAADSNQVLAALSGSPASQRLQNRTAILDQVIKYLSDDRLRH